MSGEIDTKKLMLDIIEKLNKASDYYYNGKEEIMSNYEWDNLFDKLRQLEKSSGITLPNSPTAKVSSDSIVGKKEKHEFPTLSLAKTKKIYDLVKWADCKPIWLSWKLDGLTLVVTYDNGKLTKVVTRGDGHIGTNITHLAQAIKGIPKEINYKNHLVIRGEALISYKDFQRFNLETGEEYANPRNLASGSLTLKDINELKERNINWIPFTLVSIKGIPKEINYKNHLVIRGEALISYKDFQRFNLETGEEYANPRNLASGSLTLKDINELKERNINWIPFTLVSIKEEIKSWGERMDFLTKLGFRVVEHQLINLPTLDNITATIDKWTSILKTFDFPVDGLVICYDDTDFASTGSITGHHASRAGYAFKWEDKSIDTKLEHIEWSCAASTISPVAEFKPVEIEGTIVKRASLCNISECERLGIGGKGTTISVIKANKIIPKIIKVIDKVGELKIPTLCPVCKAKTEIIISENSGTKTLHCTNQECVAKQLKKFARFVSKAGINIEGLSEQTLQKFINLGWITQYADLFKIEQYANILSKMEGFGEKSVYNLLQAIQKARIVDAQNFIYALSIPLIGQDVSKRLLKVYNIKEQYANILSKMEGFGEKSVYNLLQAIQKARIVDAQNFIYALSIPLIGQDVSKRLLKVYNIKELIGLSRSATTLDIFSNIDGIGIEKSSSFIKWMKNNKNSEHIDNLIKELTIVQQTNKQGTICKDITFVITGDVHHYKNRTELKKYIESQGGKVTGSISKSTNYLINNDFNSKSTKNIKAHQLNIPIITEEQFIEKFSLEEK